MVFRAALVLFPLAVWAQDSTPKPPPEVDRALRARVTEFFNDHVEGNFMKAFSLVAEDTKEYYFSVQKNKFVSYKLGDIDYSDNFTKATVHATAEQVMRPRPEFPELRITQQMDTLWKIENGQWVWYIDPKAVSRTPMSWTPGAPKGAGQPEAPTDPGQKPADPKAKLPAIDQKTMDQRAFEILHGSSVDKPDVTFKTGQASSQEVVFHNGQPGSVRVFVDPGAAIEGFTAVADKRDLRAGEDAVIKLHYEPGKKPPPTQAMVRVVVEPFDTAYPITVRFAP